MPSIRAMELTDDSFTITTTSGVVWSITMAELLDYYQNVAQGPPPERKQATIDWARDQMWATAPSELSGLLAHIDWHDVTGKFTGFTIEEPPEE